MFVQEVVRYLAEDKAITRADGKWQVTRDTPIEMRIPDGLRDVIGKRLSSLSEPCNKVLAVAAVIGRDFRLELLQKVANVPDEELFKALEEAKKAAVVEERTGVGAAVSCRFAHAFFRQTLYEEIIAPRRIRLHQQVARALEEIYKNRLEEHAAELAEHYTNSSDPADLKKAVTYGEMAAKRAVDVYAYGEAIRLLEQAIKVQEILDPDDKAKLCDLTLTMGDARFDVGQYGHVLDIEAPNGLSVAQALGNDRLACRACVLATKAMMGNSGTGPFATPEGLKWIKALDCYASQNTAERALADLAFGQMKNAAGELAAGTRFFQEGAELARNVADNDSFLANSAYLVCYCPSTREYVENARHIADKMAETWDRSSPWAKGLSVGYVASFWLALGDRERAESILDRIRPLPWMSRQPYWQIASMMVDAAFQIMDGHLEEAIGTVAKMTQLGEETGLKATAWMDTHFERLRLAAYLGRSGEALKEFEVRGTRAISVFRAFYLAHTDKLQEASSMVNEVLDWHAASPERNMIWFPMASLLLEAAVLARNAHLAEKLLGQLVETPFKVTSFWYPTCIARHLGGAAALLGRYEEARKYYHEAIKVCTDMRFRPELALSRLQLAELLLDYYPQEKSEAIAHIDFAIAEFRDMKMQPWPDKALRHKEILRA